MDSITWRFVDQTHGTRAAAAVFESYGQGLAISTLFELQDDDADLSPAGYEYTQTLAITQTQSTSAMLMLHFVGSAGVQLTPDNLTFTFGGLEGTFEAELVNDTTIDCVEAIGYVYVGDIADLDDLELTIAITGVSAPNVVNGTLTVQLVEGIADEVPTFFEAGTVDVFTEELTIDPTPSVEGNWGYVFAGAAQADAAADQDIELVRGEYTQIGTTLLTTTSGQAAALFACNTAYNCQCDVDPDAMTLEDMRLAVLSVTGYAANATNPPPGVELMYNNFINLAQRHVYARCRSMPTERFFSWTLQPGIRYYGLADNNNCCDVLLNRYRIEGAWVQDLNNVWWPLVYGIDPSGYTLDTNFGWPTNFEVRQCIEVFPAPQAAYTLWLKGHVQLLPLEEDDDVSTLPSTPILNQAIFLAKSHKGMKDAAIYAAMCENQISDIIAGRHVTKRYIPGTAEIPVATPPIMVRFDN